MTDKKLNIVIIEPSEILKDGIIALLNKLGFYYNCYEMENIEDIVNSSVEKLDVLIINLNKVQNRNHDLHIIKKKFPDSILITFLHSITEQRIYEVFDHSFSIYDRPRQVKESLSHLLELKRKIERPVKGSLSSREVDVLKLVVTGLSNKEIAEKLYLSIHTVISHRKKISLKTGIKSQAGLTIYAITNKIISVEDY